MKFFTLTCLCLVLLGCQKLDVFVFESEPATSVAQDYYGLPLFQGEDSPTWVAGAVVEREVYLQVPSGAPLSGEALAAQDSYVHGVFIHAPADCPPDQCPLAGQGVTLLYQHGNSGHLYRYWYRAVALWNLGVNVFIYTYRGYGLSKGETTRDSVLEDAETAMTYVAGRPDVVPSRIFAYGYSMGGIPTSYLVGRSIHRDRFAGTIIESALDSPESILNLSSGTAFPDGFFFDDTPFDGPDFIGDATCPVLHLHGSLDERVIMIQAERYYDALAGRADYTHYLGKSGAPDETWIRQSAHRNVPHWTFAAEKHIADYRDHSDNPTHCCIHPLEYLNPIHAPFLATIGQTDGTQMHSASQQYARLISDWIITILPPGDLSQN